MPLDDLDSGASRLWPLIREQVATTATAGQDEQRLHGVLARRRAKSEEFFASAAGGWDRLRGDLFGERSILWAVLGLIDPTLTVGDLGCGTGQLAETVAPHVRRVIAVDGSTDMLDSRAARGSTSCRTSTSGRATSRRCRFRPASSMRRCCRWCCTTRRILRGRWPRLRASCGPAAACCRRHAAARARGVSAADGPRLAGIFRQADVHGS